MLTLINMTISRQHDSNSIQQTAAARALNLRFTFGFSHLSRVYDLAGADSDRLQPSLLPTSRQPKSLIPSQVTLDLVGSAGCPERCCFGARTFVPLRSDQARQHLYRTLSVLKLRAPTRVTIARCYLTGCSGVEKMASLTHKVSA